MIWYHPHDPDAPEDEKMEDDPEPVDYEDDDPKWAYEQMTDYELRHK